MSQYVANKNVFSERLKRSLPTAGSLKLSGRVPHRRTGHGKCPSAVGGPLRGPSSMSVPNLKRIALLVQKL